MDKKPEIGKNHEYKNKLVSQLVSLCGKTKNSTSKVKGEESKSPEQVKAHSLSKTAKEIACTIAEQAASVVSELAEKISERKDTLIDRNQLSMDPKVSLENGATGISQPDWDALILDEVEFKSSYFASLLNLTDALVGSEQFSQKDAEQLVQKWEYAFQIGECVGISHKLAELRHDQDAKAQLAGIMQLFHHLGLKKLDVQNPVAVSPENRFYFDNGTQFPDGTVCEIARWPWLYKEKVYYRGMLCQLEDEQVL